MKFAHLFENSNSPMTGAQVMERLSEINDKSKKVYFAKVTYFGHKPADYPVNSFFSWRGSYDMPSCSSDGDTVYSVNELISIMKDFYNSTQYGYKGGEYKMWDSDPLWADSWGHYNENGVANIVECDEGVFFVVEKFEY